MIELLRGTWRLRDLIGMSVKRGYPGTQLGLPWPTMRSLAKPGGQGKNGTH